MADLPPGRLTPLAHGIRRNPGSPLDRSTPSSPGVSPAPGPAQSRYDRWRPNSVALRSNTSWRVNVRIDRVRQISNLDRGSRADFRAAIVITGAAPWAYWPSNEPELAVRRFPTIHGDDISPGLQWSFTRIFEIAPWVTIPARASIWIGLYERDDVLWITQDRVCDINPRGGEKFLNVEYDRESGRITGDASGQRGHTIHVAGAGDNRRAEIWFTIT